MKVKLRIPMVLEELEGFPSATVTKGKLNGNHMFGLVGIDTDYGECYIHPDDITLDKRSKDIPETVLQFFND